MRLCQLDLPFLFLWLATEGTEVGGPATMLTRLAAAWKPQADHLGGLAATTNVVSQKGVQPGANLNGLDKGPALLNTTVLPTPRRNPQLG